MADYVRIDAGLKRGKRKPGQPEGPRVTLPRHSPASHEAIAAAVKQYAEGCNLSDIAKQHGVSKQAVRMWLLNEVPDQYKEAQTLGLLQRVTDADEGIDEARRTRDVIVLACAREQARFARMDLERRRPHLYGPKQETTLNVVSPVLNITLAPAPQITSDIQGESTRVEE